MRESFRQGVSCLSAALRYHGRGRLRHERSRAVPASTDPSAGGAPAPSQSTRSGPGVSLPVRARAAVLAAAETDSAPACGAEGTFPFRSGHARHRGGARDNLSSPVPSRGYGLPPVAVPTASKPSDPQPFRQALRTGAVVATVPRHEDIRGKSVLEEPLLLDQCRAPAPPGALRNTERQGSARLRIFQTKSRLPLPVFAHAGSRENALV